MFKRILVPIDGSLTSDCGLKQAIQLARGQHAAMCLLHVVDERTLAQQGYIEVTASVMDRLLDSLRDSGRRALAKGQAEAKRHGVKARTLLVENSVRPVADVILDNAGKWRADLIVMGTHGRRGLSRVVLGSDAEGVVRQTKVPVLLVRAEPRKRR